MRRLLLLFTLFFSQPLFPQPWQEVLASLQDKYSTYDECIQRTLPALLNDSDIAGQDLAILQNATTEIICFLPPYIQQQINERQSLEKDDDEKWKQICNMHHAMCVLAGAVQLQLGLSILRDGTKALGYISDLISPASRLLRVYPSFGPRPEDFKLRKVLGDQLYRVQFKLVTCSLDDAKPQTKLMLTHLRDCKQVLLSYSLPASSFP